MSAAFPGMGMIPGAVPGGALQQQAGAGFVLTIAPDPTWQPIDITDTLEKDGYYVARIKNEKERNEDNKVGVWFTLELGDPDVLGKQISKLLPDPRNTTKDTWWLWRTLLRSVTGSTAGGQAGMQYTVGSLTGQLVYVRTGSYIDNSGSARTGVDSFITKAEWEDAVKGGKHRWEPKAKATGGSSGVGALPGGVPAFPGLGGGGLPGAPASPAAHVPTTPQPAAAAPMQQAPAGFPAATPPPAAAPAAFPAAAPVAAAPAFGFPGVAPPAASPAAAPTAPQPTANGFPAFPGT